MSTSRFTRRAPARTRAAIAALTITAAATAVAAPAAAGAPPPAPRFVDRTVVAFAGLSRLTVADLDEDGRPDLVGATDGATPQLSVALATGPAGSYGPRSTAALSPGALADQPLVADLDGDGNLDILVALGTHGYVWQLGNGDGTFGPLQSSATSIAAPAVGDVVGSAQPDLVARVGGVATALVGDGTGSFTATSTTFAVAGSPNQILVDDLDGDGRDDVAVSALAGNPSFPDAPSNINTFHALGGGAFEAVEAHTVINLLDEIAVGDLDEDGDLDLAVAAPRLSAQAGFYTLLGDGTGSFAAPVLHQIGSGTREIDLVDVDGDSHLDVVLLDTARAKTYVVAGKGNAAFWPAIAYRSGWSPRDLALVDVTGDGLRDLVNRTDASNGAAQPRGVNVLPARADGTFAGVAASDAASSDLQAVADVTGDGRPDLLSVRQFARVSVYPNDGKGRLLPVVSTTFPSQPTGLATGRLDADADHDVVAVGTSGLAVALSSGGGALAPPKTVSSATGLVSPVVADLTGDGKADIAVGTANGNVAVFAGSGTGAFSAPVAHAAGSGLRALASTDLDGDGDLDLVALHTSPARVSVLVGNGSGGFAAPAATALAATPQFLATGDLDGDGLGDVAVTAGTGSNAKLHPLYGTGDGRLVAGPPSTLPEASRSSGSRTAETLVVADFDADGRDDALVDGYRFLLSDCAGAAHGVLATFDQKESPATTASVADMDGDGVRDLVGFPSSGDAVVRLGVAPAPAAASPAAPFTSCRGLVGRVHRDLLQRSPTATELNTEAAGLAAGSLTRGGLVAQIRSSSEHTTHVDPVARLYRAYFLRSPDPSGLEYWVARRHAGWTLIQISNQFARSREFLTKYGSLSNTAFVDLVYENVLGRPGDPSGRRFWINRLDTKRATRGQVMLNFSDSGEYRTKQAAEVDTGVLYAWLLRRRPSATELDDAVAALEGGGTVATLATELLDRPEYAARVHPS